MPAVLLAAEPAEPSCTGRTGSSSLTAHPTPQHPRSPLSPEHVELSCCAHHTHGMGRLLWGHADHCPLSHRLSGWGCPALAPLYRPPGWHESAPAVCGQLLGPTPPRPCPSPADPGSQASSVLVMPSELCWASVARALGLAAGWESLAWAPVLAPFLRP